MAPRIGDPAASRIFSTSTCRRRRSRSRRPDTADRGRGYLVRVLRWQIRHPALDHDHRVRTDIPNASTLIVHRAGMFGLSAALSARGRVALEARAYALFTAGAAKITAQARRRLRCCSNWKRWGQDSARLARPRYPGAGNLLGENSRHIKEVGFSSINRCWRRSSASRPAWSSRADRWSPQITIGMPIASPSYVNDLSVRLSAVPAAGRLDTDRRSWYRRNARPLWCCRTGALPLQGRRDQACAAANVEKVDAGPGARCSRSATANSRSRTGWFISSASTARPPGAAGLEGRVLPDWETPEERLMGTTEILRQLANLAEDRKAA